MVLQDDPFEIQTEKTFKISASPKAIATLHLDRLSRKMCPDLDHFVVFSSVSCGRGNINQTNYGMSNSIMERICEARKSDNLPALAVEWGAIGDVGVVAEMAEQNKTMIIGGTLQQKISSCLEVLNDFMKQTNPIVSSIVVAEKRSTDANIINAIRRINDLKNISLNWTLPELGLDSMTAIELKQLLEAEFDTFFAPETIKSMTFAKVYKLIEDKKNKTSIVFENNQKSAQKRISNASIVEMPSMIKESNMQEVTQPNTSIFYFPGIEGHSMIGRLLSVNLKAQVFSFQYLCDGFSDKFEKSAEYYAKIIMKKLEPNEKLFIIGHSIGTIIATEAVRILEQDGRTGILWLIDGSYEFLSKTYVKDFVKMGTYNYIIPLFNIFSLICSVPINNKFMEHLDTLENWAEKRKLLIPLMSESFCSSNIASKIFDLWYLVSQYLNNYNFVGDKLKTKAILIRNSKNPLNITEDYELQKYFCNPMEIHKIDADHVKIVSQKVTAEIIMQNILSKTKL